MVYQMLMNLNLNLKFVRVAGLPTPDQCSRSLCELTKAHDPRAEFTKGSVLWWAHKDQVEGSYGNMVYY